MVLNKSGQCIKLRCQAGIKVEVFSMGWVDFSYGITFSSRGLTTSHKIHDRENKDCKSQHVQAKITVRCCVWWAAAVNPVLCSSWAMPSNHFPGIFQWTSVPIIPPHIFLELFILWPPAAGPAFEQKRISLPGTGCTMVQKDRGGDQRLRSNQLFLHGKRFTLHSLSIAEEAGSLQPKEFIAHSFLNLI